MPVSYLCIPSSRLCIDLTEKVEQNNQKIRALEELCPMEEQNCGDLARKVAKLEKGVALSSMSVFILGRWASHDTCAISYEFSYMFHS